MRISPNFTQRIYHQALETSTSLSKVDSVQIYLSQNYKTKIVYYQFFSWNKTWVKVFLLSEKHLHFAQAALLTCLPHVTQFTRAFIPRSLITVPHIFMVSHRANSQYHGSLILRDELDTGALELRDTSEYFTLTSYSTKQFSL